MGIRIGIDAGSTSTKLAALKDNKIIDLLKVKSVATDEDIYKIFDKFLEKNEIDPADIESINLTGVGASAFHDEIRGIQTCYKDEFDADTAGAIYFAGEIKDFLLVSMGTGTTFIHVKDGVPTHVGGLGLGGGSLVGLSKYMLGTSYYKEIYDMAKVGNFRKVNILLSDVSTNRIGELPMDITVSNFGKIHGKAEKEDLAQGLVSLVLENVIQTGCLMANQRGTEAIVLIGGLSSAIGLQETLDMFRLMYPHITFVSAQKGKGSHVTAIGAAVL